ncbi:MAG: hypothetical protein FKY71_18790 [Spiribacter salinus]|uniref:Uncharacterized protein n=1 Tax=Spiribacter salinus TaxID=1335746 RepID=A0A540V851_9GAMM|nr:MAG: hypothetical protein FKY71_18790 [Spiribacter salinus]
MKNIHICELQARFCRYALPILGADLEFLHKINGFGRYAGPFGFVVCPQGPGKVKVFFGFCD